MLYDFYCPSVTQHLVLLSVAAVPFVPFRYGLKACALRWCQSAEMPTRHTYFSKGERILGARTCPSLSVRPTGSETNIVRNQISFVLRCSCQAAAFVVVSQYVYVGIPFLAMPFQPAHHLFTQVVFLFYFFLYDMPKKYFSVFRLRDVSVVYIRPIYPFSVLSGYKGRIDMDSFCSDSFAKH